MPRSFHPSFESLEDRQVPAYASFDAALAAIPHLTSQDSTEVDRGPESFVDLSLSPDGEHLATTTYGQSTIVIRDARNGAPLKELAGHNGQVWRCTYDPTGTKIISFGQDHTCRVWDASSGAQLQCFTLPDWGTRMEMSSDGRTVAFALSSSQVLQLNTDTGEQTATGPAGDGVCFFPDGKKLASYLDRTVSVYDSTTAQTKNFSVPGHVLAFTVDPSGKYILCGDQNGGVSIIDVQSGNCIVQPMSGPWINNITCSPDGEVVYVTNRDGLVTLFDGKSLGKGPMTQLPETLQVPQYTQIQHASPKNHYLIGVVGGDQTGKLFKVQTPLRLWSAIPTDGPSAPRPLSPATPTLDAYVDQQKETAAALIADLIVEHLKQETISTASQVSAALQKQLFDDKMAALRTIDINDPGIANIGRHMIYEYFKEYTVTESVDDLCQRLCPELFCVNFQKVAEDRVNERSDAAQLKAKGNFGIEVRIVVDQLKAEAEMTREHLSQLKDAQEETVGGLLADGVRLAFLQLKGNATEFNDVYAVVQRGYTRSNEHVYQMREASRGAGMPFPDNVDTLIALGHRYMTEQIDSLIHLQTDQTALYERQNRISSDPFLQQKEADYTAMINRAMDVSRLPSIYTYGANVPNSPTTASEQSQMNVDRAQARMVDALSAALNTINGGNRRMTIVLGDKTHVENDGTIVVKLPDSWETDFTNEVSTYGGDTEKQLKAVLQDDPSVTAMLGSFESMGMFMPDSETQDLIRSLDITLGTQQFKDAMAAEPIVNAIAQYAQANPTMEQAMGAALNWSSQDASANSQVAKVYAGLSQKLVTSTLVEMVDYAKTVEQVTAIPWQKIMVVALQKDTQAKQRMLKALFSIAGYEQIFNPSNEANAAPHMIAASINGAEFTSDDQIRIRLDYVIGDKRVQNVRVMPALFDVTGKSDADIDSQSLAAIRHGLYITLPASVLTNHMIHGQTWLNVVVRFEDGSTAQMATSEFTVKEVSHSEVDIPKLFGDKWNSFSLEEKTRMNEKIASIFDIDYGQIPEGNKKIIDQFIKDYANGELSYVENTSLGVKGFELRGSPHDTGQLECKDWLRKVLIINSTGILLPSNHDDGKEIRNGELVDLRYRWDVDGSPNVIAIDQGNKFNSFKNKVSSIDVKEGDIVQMMYGSTPHTMVIGKKEQDGIWVMDTNFGDLVNDYTPVASGTGEFKLDTNGQYVSAYDSVQKKYNGDYNRQADNTIRYHFMSYDRLDEKADKFTIYRIALK